MDYLPPSGFFKKQFADYTIFTNNKLYYKIKTNVLKNLSEYQLKNLVTIIYNGIDPKKIKVTISRIVGYYSLMPNWNESKLAEHLDRLKGNYVV